MRQHRKPIPLHLVSLWSDRPFLFEELMDRLVLDGNYIQHDSGRHSNRFLVIAIGPEDYHRTHRGDTPSECVRAALDAYQKHRTDKADLEEILAAHRAEKAATPPPQKV